MHYIDIIVLVIMGIFTVIGFKRGFITEIFQIIGIFAAIALNTPISKLINSYTKDTLDTHNELIGFLSGIIAFILIFMVFFTIGRILTKTTNLILTSIPNRLIGSFFGGIKGFMVATVVLLLIRLVPAGDDFIQRNVTPDLDTDELIEGGVELALKATKDDESVKAMKDSLENQKWNNSLNYDRTTDNNSPAYSRLGYGAYKISTLMDPFIGSVKKLLTETVEETKEKLDL
ncbi:MAG: CvpA family protein [Candidatus Delongbacteria bacterium]|nr:CvpA family protein [Candidatus Delongbacteria bacterium]